MTQPDSSMPDLLAICQRFMSNVRHSRNLGIEVSEATRDSVRCRMPWREDLVGNPETGVIHGGAVFAFLDQVGGLSNACVLYPNLEITPTIDFRLDHLRPPEPRSAIIGEGVCYRLSSQVSFVRVTAWAEGRPDEPVSTGLATYMRMKIEPSYAREGGDERTG